MRAMIEGLRPAGCGRSAAEEIPATRAETTRRSGARATIAISRRT
jgi:hypothetical protein